MKKKTKILLVDDHPIILRGLSEFIAEESDLEVCGTATDFATTLNSVAKLKPNLVIIDLFLGDINGLELIRDLRKSYKDLLILVLSMHTESFYAERSLRAGAMGYLLKQEPPEIILKAIYQVLAGKTYISEKIALELVNKFVHQRYDGKDIDCLSDRELEVLEFMSEGVVTRDIAEKMSLSIKTVQTYQMRMKTKLGLDSATALIHFAVDWGHGWGK